MRRIFALILGGMTVLAMATPAAYADFGQSTTPCNDGTVTATPTSLWPPNHKMRAVTLKYEESGANEDNNNIIQLSVDSVTYDEFGSEHGKFRKDNPDFTGVGNKDLGIDTTDGSDPATVTIQLRSERFGHDRDGRTYTIGVTCSDLGFGTSGVPTVGDTADSNTATITVTVPHSHRR